MTAIIFIDTFSIFSWPVITLVADNIISKLYQ